MVKNCNKPINECKINLFKVQIKNYDITTLKRLYTKKIEIKFTKITREPSTYLPFKSAIQLWVILKTQKMLPTATMYDI